MSDFVTVPFDVDPDTIGDAAIEYLRSNVSGWEPASGAFEVWVIQALARMVAENTQVAATMPPAALKAYGVNVIGLPVLDGIAAAMDTNWTARDNLGHTIPAGTQIAHRVSGDTLIVFEVLADALIPAGATSLSPVAVQATDVGVYANGVPSGPLELVDSLSWVDSVSANAASAGGADAETDDAYRARLVDELRLQSPRPILPDDFSVLAKRVTGVYRALTVDGHDVGLDEIQQVAITGSPTGGTFTLTYSGQTTTGIAYNASAATVQAALEALSNIAVGDVACTGGPLPATPILVEFTGTLGFQNVTAMTHTDSLTGGSTPAVAVTTTRGGVAPSDGNARMVTVYPLDATGAACSPTIRAAVQSLLDGYREVTFVVNTSTPTTTSVNVTFAVAVLSGYDSTATVAACVAAVTAYLSPANWGGGSDTPPVWRSGENKVRYLDVSNVINQVTGVKYVSSLTINSGISDVTLTGTAPLPVVGTITGSAV